MRFNRIFLLNHISANESYLRMRVQWKGILFNISIKFNIL